jgi:hypothetical protein
MPFDEEEFKQEAWKEIEEQLDKEMDDIADEIFQKSQELLVVVRQRTSKTGRTFTSAITDTGFLLASGEVIKEPLKKTIRYNAPYSVDIEFGTDPHYVNPDDLINWVRRKLKIRDKESMMVATKIANFITRFGTDPQPFIRPPINKLIAEGKLKYENLQVLIGGESGFKDIK